MNVGEMISFSTFKGFKIIAGHKGVDRYISTVNVMDAPDIHNWLRGGEFVITTGYIMKENPLQIRDLINKIEKAGASALGIKLNRFIDKLPNEVLEVANELNFPIVSIPINYSFVDVINPILAEMVNKQARRLSYSQRIHKSFTELVINGGSIKRIIETLEGIIDREIIYYDTYFENIYTVNFDEDVINNLKNFDMVDILSTYIYYPIKIDNKGYGYIIIYDDKGPIGEYDKIALEHAATVLNLEIQKKISNLQIETRYRDEFIQDLIMSNVNSLQEIRNRAKLYDWDFEKGNIVAILDIDDFKSEYLKINGKNYNKTLEGMRENIFTSARKIMKLNIRDSVYTSFNDYIVFILKSPWDNLEDFKRNLKKVCNSIREEIIKKYKFTVTIGIGSYKRSPKDIHISYTEAKKAIKIGRNFYSDNKILFYEDLGIYKLFDSISNADNLKEFYRSYIGELIEYDKVNNTEFLITLKHLVKNDWNLKVTASEMYVHYNTMKYRFNKICSILNMDLKESEEKLNIAVALKLLNIAE